MIPPARRHVHKDSMTPHSPLPESQMDRPDQLSRARRFADLHARAGTVLLPNPWSAGAARLLEDAGFEALATTGAGAAYVRGVPDRRLSAADMVRNIAEICASTHLPVTADMQDGFGPTPEAAAQAVVLAAEAGAVGCSIEDAPGCRPGTIHPLQLATERIQAAVEAAARLPFPFIVTARADNFFEGIPDMDDTLERLVAYERAGAHALYAPGLSSLAEVRQVVDAIRSPLNVILQAGSKFDVTALRQLGVRRVSVGAYLGRVALDAMLQAATALRDFGVLAATPQLTAARLHAVFAEAKARSGGGR